MAVLVPGQIRLRNASRRFRVVHERSFTLKEALIRRRRTSYTELWALRDVDLDVAPGDAVGIVGRNGSGKSTLLKMLAGIIPADSGVVQSAGSMASMLELGAGFHPDFTGRENVFMNGAIHGLSQRQVASRLEEIVEFSEVGEFIDMPIRTYSSGMQMRLAFAVASHVRPDILLLDEVLAVGDEAFQRKCMGRIFDFRQGGGTLVFVSHDPSAVEQICNRAVLLDRGNLVHDGDPAGVMEAYHRLVAETPGEIGARSSEPSEPRQHELPSAVEKESGGWGTGEARIVEIEIAGPQGPTDRFLSGDTLTVRLTIDADRAIMSPHVGVGVRTLDGTMCFGSSTRLAGAQTPDILGRCIVEYTVRELPLHEGQFDVVVAVTSTDESTVYHWIDHAAAFSVFGRHPGVGVVAARGDWSFREPSFGSNKTTPENR